MTKDKITPNGEHYTSEAGLRVVIHNGEPLIRLEDVQAMIVQEIDRLPRETKPSVREAQDARKIINELLEGIGGEMERFKKDADVYLRDIRTVKSAIVGETAAMTKELKDVRQFFLGDDYKDQVARLQDFVGLCERLHALKQSGFLDAVADTMLNLASAKKD